MAFHSVLVTMTSISKPHLDSLQLEIEEFSVSIEKNINGIESPIINCNVIKNVKKQIVHVESRLVLFDKESQLYPNRQERNEYRNKHRQSIHKLSLIKQSFIFSLQNYSKPQHL